ncbi:MAG: methyltransferase domain-containing protein [Phycisphaerales bacterium]|nr:MAG: methyltransferase domain-containing protein [Phycisphaerales bacterium]
MTEHAQNGAATRARPREAAATQINTTPAPDPERAVLDRYADASERVEPALCCPTAGYRSDLLEVLPSEIIEKDYGCGDPSVHVGDGETVIDLGSGGGKICYMLSQVVGPEGRVIGVDFNDAMLDLARRHQLEIASKIGHDNVRFVKARIQDMALDLDALARWLADHPVTTIDGADALEAERRRLRREAPAVSDGVADVVVSNCVLNLVATEEKERLFGEIFRVLKKGGRAVISDIVCDETPPDSMRNDPELWSGCISGAFREDEFLQRFERAGFYGVEILERAAEPWQVVDGIEFRSMMVRAYRGGKEPCMEHRQAVVYRGPWKRVVDDDGHTLHRGRREAVCDRTFRVLTDPEGPYAGHVIGIEPSEPVDPQEAAPFDCARTVPRSPGETKNGSGPSRVRGSAPRGDNAGACDGCC